MDPLPNLLKRFEATAKSGDRPGACRILGEVLGLTGDRPDLLAARGHLLLDLGQPDAADDAARRAIAVDRNHGEALKLLGRLQLHDEHTGRALQPLPGGPHARYALPLEYPPSRRLSQRWGYATPVHAGLAALFARFRADYESRIAELRTLTPFLERIRPDFSQATAPEPGWVGGPINALDLAALYYFIWKYRPAKYLEIGSGCTTCFARRAVTDHSLSTRIVSIDPEPRSSIDGICDEVIRDGLETLPDLEVFAALQPGDIVFLDGSHRCFMNSDVTVFFLDVLPLLQPGVIVHIHDIALPFDYPEWAKHWYWSEQYVLAAYLLGQGERVRILLPCEYVGRTPGLQDCLQPPLLPGVNPPGVWLSGGSFWFTPI